MDLSALYKLLKFNLKVYLIASRCAETLLKTVEFILPLSIFLTIEMLSLTIYSPICQLFLLDLVPVKLSLLLLYIYRYYLKVMLAFQLITKQIMILVLNDCRTANSIIYSKFFYTQNGIQFAKIYSSKLIIIPNQSNNMYNIMLHRFRAVGFALSTAHKVADWQYVSKIHKSLKDNKINEAVNHLINSYLNGIVLDRQTYYNMYLKMNQSKTALSYHQIVYKLYRQSFSPHMLIVQWMKLISQTQDAKLLQQLKLDFQHINTQMPNISKPKEATIKSQTTKKIVKEEGKDKLKQNEKPTINNKNYKQNKKTQGNQQKQADKTNNTNNINVTNNGKNIQFFNSFQQFVEMLQQNEVKITISDVEIQMSQEVQQDDEHDEHQQLEKETNQNDIMYSDENKLYQQQAVNQLLSLIGSISKFKVGKIDISINKLNTPNGNNSAK